MEYCKIEKKVWYNNRLLIYQDIIVIDKSPKDISKYLRVSENQKLSDYSSINNDLCNNCFYYFIKNNCCNCCSPMSLCDLTDIINILTNHNYEILYKETKLLKEYNKNLIFLIKKLI